MLKVSSVKFVIEASTARKLYGDPDPLARAIAGRLGAQSSDQIERVEIHPGADLSTPFLTWFYNGNGQAIGLVHYDKVGEEGAPVKGSVTVLEPFYNSFKAAFKSLIRDSGGKIVLE